MPQSCISLQTSPYVITAAGPKWTIPFQMVPRSILFNGDAYQTAWSIWVSMQPLARDSNSVANAPGLSQMIGDTVHFSADPHGTA